MALLTSGDDEKKDGLNKPKTTELNQTSLADRFNKLQDSENAWKKKVSFIYNTLTVRYGCVLGYNKGQKWSEAKLSLSPIVHSAIDYFIRW